MPLLKEPIIVRCETWINNALFYANNIEKFKNVIESINDDADFIPNFSVCVL